MESRTLVLDLQPRHLLSPSPTKISTAKLLIVRTYVRPRRSLNQLGIIQTHNAGECYSPLSPVLGLSRD